MGVCAPDYRNSSLLAPLAAWLQKGWFHFSQSAWFFTIFITINPSRIMPNMRKTIGNSRDRTHRSSCNSSNHRTWLLWHLEPRPSCSASNCPNHLTMAQVKKIVSNLLQLFRHQRHWVKIIFCEEQESERLEGIGPELSVIRGRHLAVQRPLHQVLRHHQADRRHRVRVLIRRRQRISFLRKKKLWQKSRKTPKKWIASIERFFGMPKNKNKNIFCQAEQKRKPVDWLTANFLQQKNEDPKQEPTSTSFSETLK